MITNPIIPVWLMSIICIALCYLILNDKSFREKISNKPKVENSANQKRIQGIYYMHLSEY